MAPGSDLRLPTFVRSSSGQRARGIRRLDGDGESNATKDLAFLVACALAAATIAGSPHIVIANKGTNPGIPF